MKKNLLVILLISPIYFSSIAQTLRNEGIMNISGGYVLISGNYLNESDAGITLDGTITVSGNWTNNGSTNVIEGTGTNGEVIFNGTGTQTIGGTANVFNFEKLTINAGSVTQVEAGKGVNAYGACTFTSPLVLKASTAINAFHPQMATFINHSTVSGNITMELPYTTTGSSAAGPGRGMYFSSPVSNATASIFNVASGANLLWYQNEVTRQYVKVTRNTDPLTVAKGYILRSAVSSTFSFTGLPNLASSYSNNNIPRTVLGQCYLFGNPYPSVVDWDAFSKTNLSSTIWYQTSNGAGAMTLDTWNSDSRIGTNNNGIAQVDGKIPPMQSFWIQCSNVGLTGAVTLNSSNRSHSNGSATILKSGQVNNKSVIRLSLFTGSLKDETVIVESPSAKDTFDNWDSRKMLLKDGKRAEIYSLSPDADNKNLVIQSVQPIIPNKSIRLGYYSGVAGTYKLSADLTASTRTENVFLEDTRLDTIQDLFANREYTFSSEALDDTSRFILHFFKVPVLKVKSSINACYPNRADLTTPAVTDGSDTGLTYTYWANSAATKPYTTPASAGTGAYYIKGTAQNGLSTIAGPVHVAVNPAPTVVVNNPAEVKAPATIDLSAYEITAGSTGGLIYSYWTDAEATIPYNTPQFATQGQYYIKGTVASTGCYYIGGPVQVTIASNTTGIDANTGEAHVIYAYGSQVHIQNCKANSIVYIFDMLGRLQYQGILESEQEVITTGLKTGNYLVKVLNGKNISSKMISIRNGNN